MTKSVSDIYGFQNHLSAEFPSQIVVDVTEHCNLECIHCPHSDLAFQGKKEKTHIDVGLHKKLIDEIVKDGQNICNYIRYTANGEPLIHPRLIEMITYAGKKLNKTLLNLTTNGKILTKKRARALLEAGVSVFDISIDAFTSETYAKIRKKGDLQVTKRNVLFLINEIRKFGFDSRVVVSFVEQPLNRSESSDFKKFWEESGVNYVVIRRLHSAAGAKKDFVKTETDRYPCLYPWERITLSANGKLSFCPQDWTHASEVSDFREVTIKEAWQGQKMKGLRNAHLNCMFSEYPICEKCEDWSTTRWPTQGRSYQDMMKEFTPKNVERKEEY